MLRHLLPLWSGLVPANNPNNLTACSAGHSIPTIFCFPSSHFLLGPGALWSVPFLLAGPFLYLSSFSTNSGPAPSLRLRIPSERAAWDIWPLLRSPAPHSAICVCKRENASRCSGLISGRGRQPREMCFSPHRAVKYTIGLQGSTFLASLVMVAVLSIRHLSAQPRISAPWKFNFSSPLSYWVFSSIKAVI